MILIKSATIFDGTGKPPYRSDVLIKNDRISAIGNFSSKSADVVIDGLGLELSPGIIDVNTDSDHFLSLFSNPEQQDFLFQGVTTIIGGQCGSSLAPLFYGSLKSMRKWGDINRTNVDWHSIGELKQTIKKIGLGVNFGTLIGHSTIRRDLVGDEIRDLSEPETEIFKSAVLQGLKEGALGFSTGLSYIHARSVSYSEIKKFMKITAAAGKIYATHLRDEKGGILDAIRETVAAAEETGVKTIISHLRPINGHEEQLNEGLALLSENSRNKNIYFDANPFDFSVIPLYSLLPKWAQHGSLEEMLPLFDHAEHRERIRQEIRSSTADFPSMIIAEAKDNHPIIGKTVAEFSKTRNLDPLDGLLILMEITGLKALLIEKNINQTVLNGLLFHPRALIGSNTASFLSSEKIMRSARSTDTFQKFLSMARERGLAPETAIAKITSVPAGIFGLQKRGMISEGAYADIALRKDGKVTHVLVNGIFAVKDGELTGNRPGMPV
mgnify:CR=1 FL=1